MEPDKNLLIELLVFRLIGSILFWRILYLKVKDDWIYYLQELANGKKRKKTWEIRYERSDSRNLSKHLTTNLTRLTNLVILVHDPSTKIIGPKIRTPFSASLVEFKGEEIKSLERLAQQTFNTHGQQDDTSNTAWSIQNRKKNWQSPAKKQKRASQIESISSRIKRTIMCNAASKRTS